MDAWTVGPRSLADVSKDGIQVDNATKRELKQPDQFITLTEHGAEWAKNNRQTAIGAGVAAVVVILAIVGGYVLFQHHSTAAATAFGDAMQTYQTPVAMPGQPLPPGTKSYASISERAAAANAQFQSVAQHYGLTESGKLALYFSGLTYMEEGQNGPAEDTFKKVAGSWNHDLAALAKMSLAQIYEQTNRDAQAVDLYNELSNGKASTVPPGLAQIQLAELYSAEGKADKAKEIYAKLKDKDKDAKGNPGPAGALAAEKLNPQPSGPQ
jgi:tetratricopeptide (TPR) repeat protein